MSKSTKQNQAFFRTAMGMTTRTKNGDIHVSMNVLRWNKARKPSKKDYTYGVSFEGPAQKLNRKVELGTTDSQEVNYNGSFHCDTDPDQTWADAVWNGMHLHRGVLLTWEEAAELAFDGAISPLSFEQ